MIVWFLLLLISLGGVIAALMIPGMSGLILVAGPAGICSLVLLIAKLRQRQSRNLEAVVVDGSNVMHWRDGTPQVETLHEVLCLLNDRGFSPGIIFDANAGYKLTGGYKHDRALGAMLGVPENRVMVVSKGEPADLTILLVARERNVRIVTNDRYRDWADAYPEVEEPGRLIRGGYGDGKLWLDLPKTPAVPA